MSNQISKLSVGKQRANLDAMVILLGRGISQRRLYFADHPRVKGFGNQYVTMLQAFLADQSLGAFFLGVVDGQLVHEGRSLHGPSVMGAPLIRFVELLHGGGLTFRSTTTPQDIRELISLAAELKDPTENLGESRRLFISRGIENVDLAAAYSDPLLLDTEDERRVWEGRDARDRDLPSPVLIYQALFDVVTAAHANATMGRTVDIESARAACEHLVRCTEASFTDMMQLMRYPDFDTYTVGHSVRVAALAVYVGGQLGMDREQILSLGTASLLHDVGKSKIPDDILFKPGRLDAEEFAVMRQHPRLGAEILLEHRSVTPLDVAAAWGHHLRHDGGGYPAPEEWTSRSRAVALIQVCDVYEALTATRPYKKALTSLAAYRIMMDDVDAFDPDLLRRFVAILGFYPPGNHVRLSDGRLGTVTTAGSDPALPLVRLTHDDAGSFLPTVDQQEIDLGAETNERLSVHCAMSDTDTMLT